jgi:NADH-quinone oxidoreductase subunit L
MSVATSTTLILLILGFPLAGAALNALLGPLLGRRFVNYAGTLSILASFVIACVVLFSVVTAPAGHGAITVRLFQWLDLSGGANLPNRFNLSVGMDFTLDALSALMLMVITGVGFLIHVYSVGYMEHDPGVARFFSYMNLFIFSMLMLVLAADLVILIIGWALVALSSYLLIGFLVRAA